MTFRRTSVSREAAAKVAAGRRYMMGDYSAKNYTEQGGEKTVIGGTLEFGEKAEVKNFPGLSDIEEDITELKGGVSSLNEVAGGLRTDLDALTERVNALIDGNEEEF